MGLIGAAVVAVGVGIVAAGSPARGVVVPEAAEVLGRVAHDVDPATFPTISVEQDVVDWNHEIAGPGRQEIVLTLAENLELENQALLRADATILERRRPRRPARRDAGPAPGRRGDRDDRHRAIPDR